MTREQLEIISILKSKNVFSKSDKAVDKKSTQPTVTPLANDSAYNFIARDNQAFNIFFRSEIGETKKAILVIEPNGRVLFYDDSRETKATANRPWDKESTIEMGELLGLPSQALSTEPKKINLHELNHFFNAANKHEPLKTVPEDVPNAIPKLR